MFPSNYGRNQQAFVDQHLFGDQSNSRNEPSLSSFHSWPSLDNGGRFLYHDHQLQPSGQASNSLQPLVAAPTKMQAKDKAVDYSTAKRSSGKIATTQGLRGRRMRLSVNIARKFFDLQDMLGFDKASQTVGWLLMKSKEAIKELSKDNVGVGLEENTSKEKTLVKVPKVKKVRQSQKAAVCAVARESRAIARAKARVRTREKMSKRLQESKEMSNGNTHNPKRFSSHSNHDKKSLEMGVEIIEPNKPIPSTFEHHQDIINNDVVNLFPENWVMDGTRTRWSCFDILNMH